MVRQYNSRMVQYNEAEMSLREDFIAYKPIPELYPIFFKQNELFFKLTFWKKLIENVLELCLLFITMKRYDHHFRDMTMIDRPIKQFE